MTDGMSEPLIYCYRICTAVHPGRDNRWKECVDRCHEVESPSYYCDVNNEVEKEIVLQVRLRIRHQRDTPLETVLDELRDLFAIWRIEKPVTKLCVKVDKVEVVW